MTFEIQKRVEEADPDKDLLHVATFIPLSHWWDLLPFFWWVYKVAKQIIQSPGIIRFGLNANPMNRRFWTCSVWLDRASMANFVSSEPHAIVVKRMSAWAGTGSPAFVEWVSKDSPINWKEALERLKTPTYRYESKGE